MKLDEKFILKEIFYRAKINSQGIKGELNLVQESPFSPTLVNISVNPINDLETRLRYETKIAAYQIHELPEASSKIQQLSESCTSTNKMYNPTNVDLVNGPPAGIQFYL